MVWGVCLREAATADIESMLVLLQELFFIERDFAFDPGRQRRGLALLLSRRSQARVIVAESAGSVIGMCTLQLLVSTAEGGEVGLIEDVVVAPAWRGRGVGRLLLQSMEQWCRGRGLTRVQLLADRDNTAALDFYRALGWSPTALVAWRRRPLA